MSISINNIVREDKLKVAQGILGRLRARQEQGPAEAALDAFILELEAVVLLLSEHVEGKTASDATLAGLLARLETADIEVDTWLRHIDSFLWIEADRRGGANVVAARELALKACPLGLQLVDAPILDENSYCHTMMTVLRAEESQPTLTAINLPPSWLDTMDGALTESDAAYAALVAAKQTRTGHVQSAQDAESEWNDTMVRLRRYIGSRAKRGDKARQREGRELLTELLDQLAKLRAAAATRATRRRSVEAERTEGTGGS